MRWERYREQLQAYARDVNVSEGFTGNVLVTGATGMIGSALVDLLLALNDAGKSHVRVTAMGRSEEHGRQRFAWCWARYDFTFLAHDVTQPFSTEATFEFIVHAASNAYPQAFAADPVGTMTANFSGVYNLLELARSVHTKRVLYVSSAEVYGELDKPKKAETDYGFVDPLKARSCYPNSKRAAETLCVAYSEQYGINTVIVRPGHVYGPTMTDSDNRAVSEFLRCAATGTPIVMRGTGNVIRSYTYVVDVATAILTVLHKGERATAYNIADDRVDVSIRQIAKYLAELGRVPWKQEIPADARKLGYTTITRQVLDASRLHDLGWECRTDIRTGLRETLEMLRV